jgi:hypothetical protein
MYRYIGDPNVIQSPFSGRITKLCANNVKRGWLRHPSVDTSLGVAPMMLKADVITHHMPSPVPFRSLQVVLLLATQ